MNEIKIIIKGVAGVGKTTIAHNIANMLKGMGVSFSITDDGGLRSLESHTPTLGLPTRVEIKVKEA